MTKHFLSGTPLEGLERQMMAAPRPFRCRYPTANDTPVEQPKGRELAYWQLVKQAFPGQSHNALWQRVKEVSKGKDASQFLDKAHGRRMADFCQELWKGMSGKPNSPWLSIVFLLTSSETLWSRARGCIHCYDVDFSHIMLRSVSLQEYVLYQTARSIGCAHPCISATELSNRELVKDSTLSLIVDAAVIARYGTVRFPDEKEAE